MKKLAIITLLTGVLLLLYGGWLLGTNKPEVEANARVVDCDAVFGLSPANVREKDTCLAEAEQIKMSYQQKMIAALAGGLVITGTSVYVLSKKQRLKKDLLDPKKHK